MASPVAPKTPPDPNARVGTPALLETPDDFKGTPLPTGVVIGTGKGQYYAYKVVYADGHSEYEWYKRGDLGPGNEDPVEMRTPGPVVAEIKAKWDAAQTKGEQEGDTRGPQDKPNREVYRGGKWVTEPNPIYQPQPTTRTPDQAASDAAVAQTNQATAQTAAAENKEKQWNSDHGHGWVTHAERETAVRQEQTQARADQNVARQTAATEAANQLARDRLQFDRDKANLPDVKAAEVKINGQTYTRVTTATPQGQVTIKNYGPDGKEVASLPVEGAGPGQAEPPGAPPLELTYGTVSKGLKERSDWYNEQVAIYQRTGGKEGMAPDAATKAMERAVKLAEAALKEQGGVIDTQTNILGNETTQRGQTLRDTESRRSTANSIYNNTLNGFLTSAPKAGRGGGKFAGPAMQEVLAGARGYVDSFGGLREAPPAGTEGFPALHDIRSRSLAPAAPPPPVMPRPITAPSGGSAAVEQAAVAGGIGSPEAQGLLATNEANRQQWMAQNGTPPAPPLTMPAPIFTPQPPVNLPAPMAPPAVQGMPSPLGDTGAPPAEMPKIPAAVNPVNDQPITGPFSPPAQQARDDWRMGSSFVQQSRNGTAGQVSPYVQRLIADPQVDNDVLAEAYMQEYGQPLPMG